MVRGFLLKMLGANSSGGQNHRCVILDRPSIRARRRIEVPIFPNHSDLVFRESAMVLVA